MASTLLRHPAVAGRFYPDDPEELRSEVQAYLALNDSKDSVPIRAVGCLAPHAGYMYAN